MNSVPVAVLAAGQWLAENQAEAKQVPSLVGFLRKRFGLGLNDAMAAIRYAENIREGR